MNYQDCLEECIEDCTQHTNINKRSKKMIVKYYRSYPIPNEKLWAKCERKAVKQFGNDADCLERLVQYENVLGKQGIHTAQIIRFSIAVNCNRVLMVGTEYITH